jgi:hypothetical protein
MRKTKLQIIEETAAFYMEDPSRRAYNAITDMCEYQTTDGRNCAVGRYFIDPQNIRNYGVKELALRGEFLQENLIEEVRGHDWVFWESLQRFHDRFFYWDTDGITESGRTYLQELKQKYAND